MVRNMNTNDKVIIVLGVIGLIVFIKVYQKVDSIGSDIAAPITNTLQGFFSWFD